MIAEETMPARWQRHRVLADAVHAAVDVWAAPGGLSLVVRDPTTRANSVTTIATGGVDANDLARRCREQLGVTLGTGIGDLEQTSFRIGHMGHVNVPMVLGVLGSVEPALIATNAPVAGSGIAAAAQLIADAAP